ncbi:MAG: hypothetical protein WC848_02585 [Parcubacteria group bacterium]|jgi:hypothetical protein
MSSLLGLAVGAFLGVVASLWYNRTRKMDIDLPSGKIEVYFKNYKNVDGERMWQASASRGDKRLGRSVVFPSLKELSKFVAKAIELARKGEEKGFKVETLFRWNYVDFSREGEKYHGYIPTGEIQEHIS